MNKCRNSDCKNMKFGGEDLMFKKLKLNYENSNNNERITVED